LIALREQCQEPFRTAKIGDRPDGNHQDPATVDCGLAVEHQIETFVLGNVDLVLGDNAILLAAVTVLIGR
jgi:hypothetical protein